VYAGSGQRGFVGRPIRWVVPSANGSETDVHGDPLFPRSITLQFEGIPQNALLASRVPAAFAELVALGDFDNDFDPGDKGGWHEQFE
jgi:hypothetical protein